MYSFNILCLFVVILDTRDNDSQCITICILVNFDYNKIVSYNVIDYNANNRVSIIDKSIFD